MFRFTSTPKRYSPLHRALRGWMGFSMLLAVSACGGGKDPAVGPNSQPGQTDFVTEEPEGGGPFLRGGETADDGATGAPTAGAPPMATPSAESGAPAGRAGEVEEGDIYRISNNHLFYLNTYRGFVIYDVSNPSAPARLSRLPVFGYPVEMFVEGNTVYALLRDALYLTQDQGALKFNRHNVSQLVAIDISDLRNPKVLETVDITGELREGVARKVENTIYVVSSIPQWYSWGWNYGGTTPNQKEQASVYAFNVADPKDVKLVQQLKLFEGGSVDFFDPKTGVSLSRSFQDVAISATANALMVVENWNVASSVSQPEGGKPLSCGSYSSDQQAIVSIVDISDPRGVIRLHSRFQAAGHLRDQFKMTYAFDEQAKTGTFFGIFARQAWSGSNCTGSSFVQNTIESWDVTSGDTPVKLSSLPFGKPNETVRGSAYDLSRKVAYAITAVQVDPLYVIDLSDRANLKIASAIDGLSGDMNVFRLVGNNQFLMGIGRDNSVACQGFQDTSGWQATNVAVSLIDVRDLGAIRLVQRRCVAIDNAAWVGSDVNWNLDQAHKLIGMHSDAEANVVSVPVYYHKKSQENDWWWYNFETAVGLMAWDLTKYDPTKDPTAQNVLQNFGTVVHPHGEVRRSIVFTHQAERPRRMMINLSDTHISVTDIQDLAKPVRLSDVELAPYHAQIFKFGAYIVEHIQEAPAHGWGPTQGASEFRVKLAGGDLEVTAPVASFRLGQVTRVLKHGEKLVLFRTIWPASSNEPKFVGEPANEALVMDLSDPTKPRPAGTLRLPQSLQPEYRFWCGVGGYGGGYWFDQANNWVATSTALVFLQSWWDAASQTSRLSLELIDLSLPGQPKLQRVELPDTSWDGLYGLTADAVDPSGFYLAYRVAGEKTQRSNRAFVKYRYFAQRFAPTNGVWAGGPPVNLPGTLVRTWGHAGSGRLFLTHDSLYREVPLPPESGATGTTWKFDSRLHLLRATTVGGAAAAELLGSHQFVDLYLRDLVPDGGRLYVNASPAFSYYGGPVAGGPDVAVSPPVGRALTVADPSWEDRSDRFLIFDLAKLSLDKVYDRPTATYGVQMMGTHQGKLFLNLPGDGVLVVDASNPAAPVGQQFLRTLGYASHIEFAGDSAYVAAGYFGIYQMKLTGPSLIAAE